MKTLIIAAALISTAAFAQNAPVQNVVSSGAGFASSSGNGSASTFTNATVVNSATYSGGVANVSGTGTAGGVSSTINKFGVGTTIIYQPANPSNFTPIQGTTNWFRVR